MQPGDVIFWGQNGNCRTGIKHTGIYIGTVGGKQKMIVAPQNNDVVKISNVWTSSGSLRICPSVSRFC